MLTGGASDYAALHSRVRVMYGDLLSPRDVAGLREPAELSVFFGLLKNTAYGPYLADLDDKDINSRQIMHQVKNRVANAYLTIIHSAPSSTRPLLTHLYRHFELDNLKAILRGISAGSSWEQVRGILFPFGSLSTIPAEKMFEGGTIESAVAQITHSPYNQAITQSMKRFVEERSLFPVEVALDLDYWRKLWGIVNSLPRQDRAQALRVLGPLLDLNNLMWALRYRIYHHLSEEEIINYTLPFGYRVRDEDIRAIAAGADMARIVQRLNPDLSEVEELLREPEKGLPRLELKLQRRLRQHLTTFFAGYPFHIGLPLAFVILLELELQDLIVIVEAKSVRMSSDETNAYLLLNTNPGNLSST